MPLDRHDLLRQTGYEQGDFIPLVAFNHGSDMTTSSDTYQPLNSENLKAPLVYSNLFPDGVQTGAMCNFVYFTSSTDMDLRLRNITDSENALEGTDLTFSADGETLGPVEYTPSTTGEAVNLEPEFANGDDVTQITVFSFQWSVGVFL